MVWPIHCGPEIGVASTKAFTAQVCVLIAIAVAAAKARGRIDDAEEQRLVRVLLEAPRLIAEAIGLEDARQGHRRRDRQGARRALPGRGPMSALALEGALKLKEISYIHAEGYAAGELKHGPIALVDEATPIIILAPYDSYFEKSASNMSEVMARGGQVVFITDPEGRQTRPGRRQGGGDRPGLRSADRAAGDVRPDPAAGLPRGRGEGRRRRPAPQPGQVRHRRMKNGPGSLPGRFVLSAPSSGAACWWRHRRAAAGPARPS